MIHKVQKSDLNILANLAILMWNTHSIQDLMSEFSDIMENENAQIYLLYNQDEAIGFAQCQLRYDYVEGTESSPVGYLEGIFVKEEYRHSGYAKELLVECENWALSKGCKEFASDCELDNTNSLKFHLSMGFTEANRVICFTKKL